LVLYSIDYNSWFGKSGFFNKKSWQLSQINFQLVVTKKKQWFSCLQGAAELARPEMLRQWLQEGADVEDGMGMRR